MSEKKTRKPSLQIYFTDEDRALFESIAHKEGFDQATTWALYHLRRLARGIEATTVTEEVRAKQQTHEDEIQNLYSHISEIEDLLGQHMKRITAIEEKLPPDLWPR